MTVAERVAQLMADEGISRRAAFADVAAYGVPPDPIALCPECAASIGGACAGPDGPWRRAYPGEACEAADCEGRP